MRAKRTKTNGEYRKNLFLKLRTELIPPIMPITKSAGGIRKSTNQNADSIGSHPAGASQGMLTIIARKPKKANTEAKRPRPQSATNNFRNKVMLATSRSSFLLFVVNKLHFLKFLERDEEG